MKAETAMPRRRLGGHDGVGRDADEHTDQGDARP
jgi:hypothetical protein